MAPPEELKILHLADVHLGAALPWLGDRGAAQRRQIRETFGRALEQAVAERVGLVLIAGDLFAAPRPARELVHFVAGHLGRLAAAGIPTVLAAGDADALERAGYADGAFDGLSRITVLPAERRAIPFSDLGVVVVGQSVAAGTWGRRAEPAEVLKDLGTDQRLQVVGLAHLDPNRTGGRDAVSAAVTGSGAAYVALGGYHQTLNLETRPSAWYPGAPELFDRSDGSGATLLVTMKRHHVSVAPLALPRRRFRRIALEAAAVPTAEALSAEINAQADPDLALEVRLTGRALPDRFVDVRAVTRTLAPRFFTLEIADDSVPDLSAIDPAEANDLSIRGKFLSLMTRELQQAGGKAERRRIGRALRLGLWLLSGQGAA